MEPCDTSCEPMDIDLSINSINATFDESARKDFEVQNSEVSPPVIVKTNPDIWHIKKYHIKKKTEKKMKTYKHIMALLVLPIAIFVFYILSFKCTETLDLTGLKAKLEKKLHDQSEVIIKLIDGLSMDTSSKILFLYGGTGVGKTYTTTILLENLWNSSNVYHYTMPSFVDVFSLNNMFGLNICKTSIVVIDDLKQHDIVVIKKIIQEIIKKSEDLNKNITIILVYNCDIITKDLLKKCDDEFLLRLKNIYNDVNVFKKFIKFEPLTQDTIRKCIKDELGDWNIDVHELNRLLNNFNASLDGCKGVYKKIKFLVLT